MAWILAPNDQFAHHRSGTLVEPGPMRSISPGREAWRRFRAGWLRIDWSRFCVSDSTPRLLCGHPNTFHNLVTCVHTVTVSCVSRCVAIRTCARLTDAFRRRDFMLLYTVVQVWEALRSPGNLGSTRVLCQCLAPCWRPCVPSRRHRDGYTHFLLIEVFDDTFSPMPLPGLYATGRRFAGLSASPLTTDYDRYVMMIVRPFCETPDSVIAGTIKK
ncbi:hypothetical protein M011DRAFT_342807 [Sporormia fimetaria CBS 119925]|uniref:Uncharacterized protein n=1 Tax=Sporormia fimetaria CBS 119925 TaxID=1340428 RepID=A0A6A6VEZ9_9PLEO|nr:hypothetical protein M011DRAFT_342807 [Sporormia fimetaria CBS 119925]